jgi:uncharacterized protein YidB (DUF937 family)
MPKISSMLEQLINSLKTEVGGHIMSQTNLPAGQIDQVFSVIGNVAKKEVTGHMLEGNLSDVMNLFSEKPNNPGADRLQSNISSGVITDLTSRLGLSSDIANKIASVALPALVKLITAKNNTTPEDDPSPLTELFGAAGGKGFLGEAAKNLLGKFLNK